MNQVLVDSDKVGDCLMKVTTGTDPTSVGAAQPQFTWANQVRPISHDTAGVLQFAVGRDTKVVDVTASANITGLDVIAMELLGDTFGRVIVRVTATAAISVQLGGGLFDAIGDIPATLAVGQVFQFEARRFFTNA